MFNYDCRLALRGLKRNALGQTIYVTSDEPERIIGIVDRLQAPVIEASGAASMLALGQLAVLWPARRAASVPPALATRGG